MLIETGMIHIKIELSTETITIIIGNNKTIDHKKCSMLIYIYVMRTKPDAAATRVNFICTYRAKGINESEKIFLIWELFTVLTKAFTVLIF